ncbi:hypothetical protein SAMN02745121_08514 [Nannocystis exedens]|uniref:Uncharacterized protein n=1 Tax=Nannocystis exedens TaxID=54 RepID=A0A1I2IA15_9BACT|nr:lipoprotein [Nannocystis exedens]SFF38470.1 hypothetical protein SAMN02745121_08514 [Nannocystis exedens]
MPACARPGVYVPRQTHDCDAAVLVRRHLTGFLERLEESGHGLLPEFVKAELEGFAGCGDFARGFVVEADVEEEGQARGDLAQGALGDRLLRAGQLERGEVGRGLLHGEGGGLGDLAGETCESQGFGGGTLGCNADCGGFDVSQCDPCGNDQIDDDETCDGAALANETCESQGFGGGALACNATCDAFDTSQCDVLDPGETCDGAALGTATCESLGFDGGVLTCAADSCGAFDTSGCIGRGNDKLDGDEPCDGTELGGETCETQGFFGGTLACSEQCDDFDLSQCTDYGNNQIDAGETCDGSDLGGATCESQGFAGGVLTCATGCGAFDTSACTKLSRRARCPFEATAPRRRRLVDVSTRRRPRTWPGRGRTAPG